MPVESSQHRYFPPPRDEVLHRLRAGDDALIEAMHQNAAQFLQGAVIVKAGDKHQSVHRLISGTAARVRTLEDGRRQVVTIFLPGDLLAVKAMLVDRQPDSIECLSECAVEVLPYADAIALAAANPDVAFRFMWQLSEDQRRLQNYMTMLGRGSAVERIATLLVEVTARLKQLGLPGSDRREIAIRPQDIADHLGLTIVHVNRMLRTLREEGAIVVKTGKIAITDLGTVGRYAAPMLDLFEREAPEFNVQQ